MTGTQCVKLDLEMAAPFEARQKQRAVIEFLVAEGETSLKIHNRLRNVYKDNTIDYSNVKRWVQRFKKSTEDHEEVIKPASSIRHIVVAHQPLSILTTKLMLMSS